jgi:hypothetical protein
METTAESGQLVAGFFGGVARSHTGGVEAALQE